MKLDECYKKIQVTFTNLWKFKNHRQIWENFRKFGENLENSKNSEIFKNF